MPRRTTDYSVSKEFVEFVMDELRVDGPTELATKLELGVNSARTVTNWIAPTTAPDFRHTMTLLSRAGLLSERADAKWREIIARADQRVSGERPDGAGVVSAAEEEEREVVARLEARARPPMRRKRSV